MDQSEQDDSDLLELAVHQSLQDAHKMQRLQQTNRNEPNSETFMKIMTAIDEGDVCCLQTLSCSESAFTERDSRGRLPLHAAAVRPRPDVLLAVLHACPSTDRASRTVDGDTSLVLAVKAGLVDNVRILLQDGVSPHDTNMQQESPLLLAVRQRSCDLVQALLVGGANVDQVCLRKRTAVHEAAKVGSASLMLLLLRHGAEVSVRDGQGVTPLAIAAEYGNVEVLKILIQRGGDVNSQAANGDSVLHAAAGSGSLSCVDLLLLNAANPNAASYSCQLPVHRAAYEGHVHVLRTLLPVTSKRAIRLSGQSPVHSAADGGHTECLQLLILRGYAVNARLAPHISENFGDRRTSPLYLAVSNGDVACAELLLASGARTDLDPLSCVLVAVRAKRYDLVRLLLSYGAEVNCHFSAVTDTLFPTALTYSLSDPAMMRLLLNYGYHAHRCFHCCHGNGEETDSPWTELHHQAYQAYSRQHVVTFCEFVSVSWLTHLMGGVVRTLLDYVGHVNVCPVLRRVLEKTAEWDDILQLISRPRSLQHSCRLLIRRHVNLRVLNDPEVAEVTEVAEVGLRFPPRLKDYLTYRDDDVNTA